MTVGTFKGRITPLNLTEILKFLKESGKSGYLRAESGPETRGLYVRRGRVTAADSSDQQDSLLGMLESAGRLDAQQVAACDALAQRGVRPGRALIETGALTPPELWEWTETRVRAITRGILSWETGAFAFEEGTLPGVEWMLVDLDILDLILASLREMQTGDALNSRLPEPEATLEIHTFSEGGEAPILLPHERYALTLINGKRTVGEIGHLSELGDKATRKILCMLYLVGCLRHRRAETVDGAPLPAEDSQKDVRTIVRAYNEMFAYLYEYMIREVGPIAEHVLDKYLREVREANQALYNRVALAKDGTLAEETLIRNLNLQRDRNRRDVLISGLNEYLYSGLLAVKRTLGPDHEEVVIRRLNELRRSAASLG